MQLLKLTATEQRRYKNGYIYIALLEMAAGRWYRRMGVMERGLGVEMVVP